MNQYFVIILLMDQCFIDKSIFFVVCIIELKDLDENLYDIFFYGLIKVMVDN